MQNGCFPGGPSKYFFPFGICTLRYKYELDPSQATQSTGPTAWYRGRDVAAWKPWPVNGSTYTQACKAFTSGASLPLLIMLIMAKENTLLS